MAKGFASRAPEGSHIILHTQQSIRTQILIPNRDTSFPSRPGHCFTVSSLPAPGLQSLTVGEAGPLCLGTLSPGRQAQPRCDRVYG